MKPVIGITMGDPAGIGPEIIAKALSGAAIYKECIPVVIGDLPVMQDALRVANADLTINVISDPSEALGSYGTIDLIDM